MRLFKKILSAVLSFGMIFNFALSSSVFAGGASTAVISGLYIPKTLEESCVELDKILVVEKQIRNGELFDGKEVIEALCKKYGS